MLVRGGGEHCVLATRTDDQARVYVNVRSNETPCVMSQGICEFMV
jgi:hypothetical protein